MDGDKVYREYIEALDRCIELSRKKAFGLVEGTLTGDEVRALSDEHRKALFDAARKRNEWMKVRQAGLLGLDD